jgi:hypothetical protein
VYGPQLSGPQRILVLARSVSVLGDFAAPVALSFAVLALAPGPEAASRLALVPAREIRRGSGTPGWALTANARLAATSELRDHHLPVNI